MITIGCDFHTRIQQIAMLDPTTGEIIDWASGHDIFSPRRNWSVHETPHPFSDSVLIWLSGEVRTCSVRTHSTCRRFLVSQPDRHRGV